MIENNPYRQASNDKLQACLDAWNAKEKARVEAEEAAKAARRADPKVIAQAERARAYRERNKEKIAQKARERRERERQAQQAAREAVFGKPLNAADYDWP
jgi:hypothetical protein